MYLRKCAAMVLGLFMLAVLRAAGAAEAIRIAAPIMSPPWAGAAFIEDSVHYLRWRMPDLEIQLEWERPERIPGLLDEGRYEIAVMPTAVIDPRVLTRARSLTSMASRRSPEPDHGAACVMLVAAESDLHELKDLHGVRAATADMGRIDGYLACLGELAAAGANPDEVMSATKAYGATNERSVLAAVRSGAADVAMIRAGYLEDVAEASGRNAAEGLRVVGVRSDALADLHSTDTYPGPTVFAADNVDPKLIHRVLSALLSKPLDGWGRYWTVPSNLEGADVLAERLRMGPYAYLKAWTIERVWNEWRTTIVAALLTIIALIVHGWRSEVLVRRRTEELKASMRRQIRARHEIEVKKERILALEKEVLVGQLSSVFAHEMNLPLGSIRNVLHGMRVTIDRMLESPEAPCEDVLLDLDGRLVTIREQLDRAAGIVERVRGYARKAGAVRKPCPVIETVENVLRNLSNRIKDGTVIVMACPKACPAILADPIEFELVLQNLIKNALEATTEKAAPKIGIDVENAGECVVITISDNGAAMTEARCAQLRSGAGFSTKQDGLGLGLKIATSLVERCCGRLQFAVNDDSGLSVTLTLPAAIQDKEGITINE